MSFFVPTKFVWRFGGNQVRCMASGPRCASGQGAHSGRASSPFATHASPLLLALQVHLCGSFTRWVETVPMTSVEGQAGTFTVVVHLPPG
jgi:hypothetical protein